jgi:hypothetical protein
LTADQTYTITDNTLVFDAPASGTVHLSDGSDLDFTDVERITW